jgi:glycosyltransferase EpsF
MKDAQPTKVLHIISSLGVGGAETWLMELLRFRVRNGSGPMDFLMTSGAPGVFDEEARALGARIHYVRYGRDRLGPFTAQFRRIMRNGRYHAIHDHQDYVSGWHFVMGGSALPPVRIAHVHNPRLHIEANYAITLPRRLSTAAGKWLVNRLATNVCGTSAEILRQYGFDGDTIRPAVSVVHCGFDVQKFNAPRAGDRQAVLREFGWPQDTSLVLFAGRLDRALSFEHPQNHKNSWFALNVVRAAVDKNPSIRLLMAGEGGESRDELERRIQEWGLHDKIRLIGIRSDVPCLMRAADALLFPSCQEGLGMVAVEAQAACLPVLASSAVPRECVIIPELYESLPLSEPIAVWASALLRTVARPRPPMESCRRAVAASPFSIVNSAQRLEEIYRGAA